MKNPYIILGISQNATKVEIVKAQTNALRLKKYDAKEITSAQKELNNPARRLAVDFTYPILEDLESIAPITSTTKSKVFDLTKLDINKYKS